MMKGLTMEIFWEAFQCGRIARADLAAARAEVKADLTRTTVQKQILELEQKIDHLALKCQALWELVKRDLKLSDTQIADKIAEIDLRDGTGDGKITHAAVTCDACGRIVGKKHSRCVYCGEPMRTYDVFDPKKQKPC